MQSNSTLKKVNTLCLKVIVALLMLVSLKTTVQAQVVVLNEGFTTVVPLPTGWASQNLSSPVGTTGWFQGNSGVFPAQNGPITSYIGANFNNVSGANIISNWLFLPAMTLTNGDILRFYTRTVDAPAFPDRLQVRMSTNGTSTNAGTTSTSVGDFTTLLLDINPTYTTSGYPNTWTLFTVTITGVASPTTGRLAFRYFVEDGGPNGNNSDYIGIDNVTYTIFPPPCTGTPNPGNTLSSVASVCPGIPFDLSLQNNTPGSLVTYQWQQASALAGPYSNITGATSPTLSTNITANTYFRCNVTCGSGPTTTASNPVLVSLNPPTACYCSSGATSTADEDIFNVTVGTMSNSSTCATIAPGPLSIQNRYSNYTSGTGAPAAPNVFSGAANPVSVTIGTCGGNFTNSVAVFIDLNQDGDFVDTGEKVYVSAAGAVGPHTETGLMNIPGTATLGTTRMRVVNVETGTPGSIVPCGTYTWGETEDYNVNIVPCVQGVFTTVPANTSTSCGSNASFTVAGTGSLLTFSWQFRTSATGAWQTVNNGGVYSGATTTTLTLTNVPGTMSGYQYRALMQGGCTAVDFSSPPATLTVTPLIATVNPTSATICTGSIQTLTLTNASSPSTTSVTNNTPVAIPDANATGIQSTIAIAGIPAGAIVTNVSVRFNIPAHTWVGDLDINLIAPNGGNLNLVGGLDNGTGSNGTDGFVNTVISSTSTTPISGAPAPRTGTFAAEKRAGYGPTGNTQTVTDWPGLLGTLNGNWRLAIADFFSGDVGTLTDWTLSITYGAPATGVWTSSPATPNTMFTDAAATVPYVAGAQATTIYVKPTANTSYSVVYSTATPCVSNPTVIPVNVTNPVTSVVNPSNRSTCLGGTASFTVSAGGGPLTYQWQVSTAAVPAFTNITGATAATLNVTGVTAAMSGNQYRAVITAAPCGSVTSGAATLTVLALPTITLTANPVLLTPGMSTTVTATSLTGASYAWTRNGASIGGLNTNTRLARIDSIGTYRVTVTDANGCVNTSNEITIGTAASDRLWIYPNPTTGGFQVRYYYLNGNVLNERRVVQVHNSAGVAVLTKIFALDNTTNPYLKMDFDMTKFASGIYTVTVLDQYTGTSVAGKLIVQR